MSNAATPSGLSMMDVDGSANKLKRRLSDASEDSATANASKSKKFIGADGKTVKDGSNKTKSGRFKPGAPVDLDEQCGVIIDKTGTDKTGICSRSLTCKTHGVGAKRSVPGRSKPFDTLLIEFQKRKELRLASKAAREKEKEKQQANIAMATPGGVAAIANANTLGVGGSGGGAGNNAGNAADISVGDDIAVPQAGPSASMIIHSPSPMNSIAFSQHQGNDDIQVYQNLLQPSQQPPSRPPSGSIAVPGQGSVGKSGSQPGNQQDAPSASSHPTPTSANQPTSTSGVKQKPSQITLNTGAGGNNSNTSPAKSTTATAGGTALTTTKKKRAADGVKTSKNKASTRNKADLILGEVDDPPEPANAVSATLVGADGNLIVEEEAPDSDDEVDQLLLAMTQSRPRPLAMPTFAPYERTPMKLAKYRESFLTAFTGRSMSSSAS